MLILETINMRLLDSNFNANSLAIFLLLSALRIRLQSSTYLINNLCNKRRENEIFAYGFDIPMSIDERRKEVSKMSL